MAKEATVRNQIFSAYDSLFDAEKKVADYLMNHQEKAIEMSVSELAAACEASQATIVRFCKKIGCNGYHHLKIKMAKEMREQDDHEFSNEISIDNIEQSLMNIMASKMEELKETLSSIDGKMLREIIDLILNAKVVEFTAMGNTIPIALDGSYKFNQLGIPAVGSTIWETQEAYARTMRKGDVMIAVSASGASRHLLNMANIAKENGVKVVAITNQAKSPLAEASDYTLVTATRKQVFHDQVSFTRMAAMAVIDSLFLLLFSTKWDSFKNLTEHEQSVAEDKI
ncbi:MurR/RpiR family transcriptional regulator [Anaerostipes caccae]|uniref:MurR/RpiR family transcriptional regulator n=1 Tax=Anaerostipes caccae TaxID=105841 RepID=UPI001CD6EF03|nr:MurR/RpiR family transcriptional regulator [Anaerostipes caccae]UBS42917.1 MurR/RpiR family transcriptional regulator [Anaerostipes caccae]